MGKFEDGCYGSLKGIALIAKALAGRCKIHYTRVAAGKGAIPEGSTPKTMEEPADYVMDAMISAVTNPVDGECQVTVQINSANVETGFYVTGLLLYAEDPDEGEVPFTYLVLENEPEWIRPSSSIVGKLATFDLIAAIGDVDKVSAAIDVNSLATAAVVQRMIEKHNADSTAHFDIREAIRGVVVRMDIVIPVDGWEEDTSKPAGAIWADLDGKAFSELESQIWSDLEGVPEDTIVDGMTAMQYKLRMDIPIDGVTPDMVPFLTIPVTWETETVACGMCPVAETMDGVLRLRTVSAPSRNIPASLTLLRCGSEITPGVSGGSPELPVATYNRAGIVKPGAGLLVSKDGTLSVDMASGEDVRTLLDMIDGKEGT